MTPNNGIACQCCGEQIGEYVQVDGRVLLQVGPLRLTAADGACVVCGQEWHWNASMKRLDDLLAKLKNRKIALVEY